MTDRVQTVVVGAGVVGLAVARALALDGREVCVLEALDRFGSVTSARNSEVLHAGLHHAPGALKSRLCVAGRQAWLDYAQRRGIAHRVCGKLIVATDAQQLPALEAIAARAAANGVRLMVLTGAQAKALEPALHAHTALLSPDTAIVDSHALMQSLLADLESAGGQLVLRTPVQSVQRRDTDWLVRTVAGDELACAEWVNAAGLGAWALARRTEGLLPGAVPPCHYAKGNYFAMARVAPFQRLIYPVPQPGGLGIHLTLDLAGQARFGPDVQWTSDPADTAVDTARAPLFEAAVRAYWPDLPANCLLPAYAGVRPKLSGPGADAADFLIQTQVEHGGQGLIQLFGIESPGLTSALTLADLVRDKLNALAV